MNLFNRFWFVVVGLSLFATGCINVGSRFDFRRYPTPIATPQAKGTQHVWCPDSPSPTFNGPALPSFPGTTPSVVPAPMPKGPNANTTSSMRLDAPTWRTPE